MRLPIESKYPIPLDEIEEDQPDHMKQLEELHHERIKTATLIEQKQKRVKEKMEASKDLANPYQVSNLVLLYAPAHKRKLEQANEGPFRIKEVGPRRTYVLETMGGVEYMKVLGRRLVPYKDRMKARVEIGEASHPLD
ncbi:2509_t:CDS:1 [Paraglomus occultum]|uniref:2509_t:CDS:1 n=1 Tax=Paraglomus occultum TaxID=144539 RepID=A0A9N9D0W1_9GLOM|nr:2509_t:CDS:1 [Paraglomus occultum]